MAESDTVSAPHKPLVLIVEDDEVLLTLLLEVIQEAGADGACASTADEGLRALEGRSDIALLLTDVRTPGRLSGWDLAAAAYQRSPTLPVIIMSGYSYQPGSTLPPSACFIHKPCPLDTLTRLVKERLSMG